MTDFPLPNSSTDLDGQVALVTGTTSGLGRRFAKVLAASGARVVVTGRRYERLEELAAEIRADGGQAAPVQVDVTDADQLVSMVDQAEALAVEWVKFGINVNGIAPGAFASEMMDGMLERLGDFSKHFPRQRLGDPAQLDSTLLYLCSPASEFVTGTVVKVDDGQGPR
jgi:NAD(P)-dependent dehydrogenase (short-subunit alcohol dehydrogenase family)